MKDNKKRRTGRRESRYGSPKTEGGEAGSNNLTREAIGFLSSDEAAIIPSNSLERNDIKIE